MSQRDVKNAFAFDVVLSGQAKTETIAFSCSRFGEVTHAYFNRSGAYDKSELGGGSVSPHWSDVIGTHDLTLAYLQDAVAELACVGFSLLENEHAPFLVENLQAFFEVYKDEDDASQRSWPMMMVWNGEYTFALRTHFNLSDRRITHLRVSHSDANILLIEFRDYLLKRIG